jgi:hypothetical protein
MIECNHLVNIINFTKKESVKVKNVFSVITVQTFNVIMVNVIMVNVKIVKAIFRLK